MRALSLSLPDETVDRLHEIADATGSSANDLLARMIEELVAEWSDAAVADARRRDDVDEVISSAELRQRLARQN
jgi:predicted transcriptional regulator